MDTFREYRFRVRSYECGKDGFATLPTVCNYLQEAASMHAEELGFSKNDFAAAGMMFSYGSRKDRTAPVFTVCSLRTARIMWSR